MPQPINVDRRWFDLEADPAKLESAATEWETLGETAEQAGEDLQAAATKVYDEPWEGETYEAYRDHQVRLRDDAVDMTEAAAPIAAALRQVAEGLRDKQTELTDLESQITGQVSCTVGERELNFQPETADESEAVLQAVDEAKAIRSKMDDVLDSARTEVSTGKSAWAATSTTWGAVARGDDEAFGSLPPEAENGSTITLPDGSVVVNTGDAEGDDDVSVTTESDGTVVVTVNGVTSEYPAGTDVVLRTGGGDDNIEIDTSEDEADVTVFAGDGNNTVEADSGSGLMGILDRGDGDHTIVTGHGDNTVITGDGDHQVATGSGEDTVSLGGGDNHVYVGDGDDTVNSIFPGPDDNGDNVVSSGGGDDTVNLLGDGDDRIYTQSGDNTITVADGDNTIVAGSGNDEIYGGDGNDQIHGGSGQSYIEGGGGNDRIYAGGGDNVIYGISGDNQIYGGTGHDFISGGSGNDELYGRDGENILTGSRGENVIYGGTGEDVIYGGNDEDYINGWDGETQVFVDENEDTVAEAHGDAEIDAEHVDTYDHSFVEVNGSDNFQERTQADMDMMANSPSGAAMLSDIEDNTEYSGGFWPWDNGGHNEVTVEEHHDDDINWHRSDGGDSHIEYNPSAHHTNKPPVTSLYHEFAHAYNHQSDTYIDGDHTDPNHPDFRTNDDGDVEPVPNRERQAVGLPVDHDGDGTATMDVYQDGGDHPYSHTENGFREEMGWELRETYGRANP